MVNVIVIVKVKVKVNVIVRVNVKNKAADFTARCNVFLMLSMIKIYLVPNTFAALRRKLRTVAHLVVGSVHAGDDNVVVVQTNNLQFCINILFHISLNLKVQHSVNYTLSIV